MDFSTDYYTGERLCYVEDGEVLNYGGGTMVATFDDHYIYDRNNRVIGRLGVNDEVWDENNNVVARIYRDEVRGEDEYDEYRIEVLSSCTDTEKAALFWGAVLIKR